MHGARVLQVSEFFARRLLSAQQHSSPSSHSKPYKASKLIHDKKEPPSFYDTLNGGPRIGRNRQGNI
eukprot:425805-Pelagomonas_calceolata.AAC.4